jgi:2-keto-3-deoxy-L-rhamnonate aldolase RhmA
LSSQNCQYVEASSENPVRAPLKAGRPAVSATITLASPEVAARNMILATRGLKAIPFIRVPVNELWTAKRALDMGALGVIFPFTSTPELARQAVAACKYPPLGKRGAGAHRRATAISRTATRWL